MTNGIDRDLSDLSMMELFHLEAENQCHQLAEDLLALEQDPTAAALLESLMRASHSIKGAARVVGLHPAVQVAHAMEDVFVAAQNNKITLDQDAIDQLLQGVDLLNSISRMSDKQTENSLAEKANEINALLDFYGALAKGEKSRLHSGATPNAIGAAGATGAEIEAPEMTPLPVDLSSMSLLDLFRMEAETHCLHLSEGLLALENDPTASGPLQSMMRACHAIRGAATIVALHDAVKLAQSMEKLFTAASQGKIILGPEMFELLYNGVELLTAIAGIPEGETEEWFALQGPEITALVKKLTGIHQREIDAKLPPVDNTYIQQETASEPGPATTVHVPEKSAEPDLRYDTVKKPARRADDKDGIRSVRVSAQNMERMMGLAGELLIESRWLPIFGKNLLRLKYRQDDLHQYLDKIRVHLQHTEAPELTRSFFNDLQDKLDLCRSMLHRDMEVLEDHATHNTSISNRLYKEIITSKMRPFSEGVRGFARMVRDVARELGKKVTFEIIGHDTMVDRDILDRIEAPLNHMLRNALDHGIELPAERIAKGKSETGTIQLIARHSAGMLNITVKDDGSGIDLEKLRRTITEKNLCTPDLAAALSEQELLEFLFLPNFTTKKNVSNVSGRGVGLDVVHAVINEVRGKIHSATRIGMGTSFELQLPLTLSVLRGLIAEINRELYGFPLAAIDHVLQLIPEQIQEVEGRQYFTLHGKRIGIISAQQIFNTETPAAASEQHIYVIILSDRLRTYGLTVDKLTGVRDLVVQQLDSRLGKIKDINAAAILEDGTPVLIIDVEDVFHSLDQLISGDQLMQVGRGEGLERRTKRVLVADDSITVREVERKMLVARGYGVDVAVDGMDAWNMVRANKYDLIISDIDMPRMNGFELVALIKNDANLQTLPVIIVSYKDRAEERKKGLEVGADYYLSKGSFQDQALVDAVLDLIGEAHE